MEEVPYQWNATAWEVAQRVSADTLCSEQLDSQLPIGRTAQRRLGTCLTRCPALGIRMISSSKFSFPGEVFPQLSNVTKDTGMWSRAGAWTRCFMTTQRHELSPCIVCPLWWFCVGAGVFSPFCSSELLCVGREGFPVFVRRFWPRPETLRRWPSSRGQLVPVALPEAKTSPRRCSFYLWCRSKNTHVTEEVRMHMSGVQVMLDGGRWNSYLITISLLPYHFITFYYYFSLNVG